MDQQRHNQEVLLRAFTDGMPKLRIVYVVVNDILHVRQEYRGKLKAKD